MDKSGPKGKGKVLYGQKPSVENLQPSNTRNCPETNGIRTLEAPPTTTLYLRSYSNSQQMNSTHSPIHIFQLVNEITQLYKNLY